MSEIARLREEGWSWPDIAKKLGRDKEALRSQWRREQSRPTVDEDYGSVSVNNRTQVRVAFPTDMHVPYHDQRAVSVAVQIVSDFDPDLLACGSDALDFYAISDFNQNPERTDTLQKDIDAWQLVQRSLNDASPNADRFYIIGNHTDRWRRWLWKHREIANLRSMMLANLLEFEKLGIERDCKEIVVLDNLLIKHGDHVSPHSAYTAKWELDKEKHGINIFSGHTHREGHYSATTRRGVVSAYECFCLCGLSAKEAEYTYRPNWQQGIMLATVTERTLFPEPVPIREERGKKVAYWRGKRYTEE